MGDLVRLLPIIVGMSAGFVLRRIGLLHERDGESVFKLAFYVLVPAVTFTSLSTVHLDPQHAIFPAAAAAMILAGYLGSRIVAARARLDPVRAAVAVSGCMVVNTSFQLPFVQLLYGIDGVARIAMFDIVNSVATFTLAYLVAVRGNPGAGRGRVRLDRLAKNPALYAVALGLLVNLGGVTIPDVIASPVAAVGATAPVLIPIGIGILFNPIVKGTRTAALLVGARMSTALLVATAFAFLPGIAGIDRSVLLLIGAAPMVFAVVAFAAMEDLDVGLATNAMSLSMVVSVPISILIIFAST
jgi:predicted permease